MSRVIGPPCCAASIDRYTKTPRLIKSSVHVCRDDVDHLSSKAMTVATLGQNGATLASALAAPHRGRQFCSSNFDESLFFFIYTNTLRGTPIDQ